MSSVAFVSPRFPEGATVGGAETLLASLARSAAAAGLRVSFLTTCARDHVTWRNEFPAGRAAVDGVDVWRFPVDADRDVESFLRIQERISRGRPVSDEEEQSWLRNSVNSAALQSHLAARAGEYDRIVLGPYLFGLIHAAAAVCPGRALLVPCLHDEPFAYVRAIAAMFRAARGCLFNSAPERALAVRLYGERFAAMPVVGLGVKPFAASASAFAARRRLEAPYVMYSGRREPLKGTPLLLDYLAAFRERTGRDIKLVLTGSGPVEPPSSLAPHVLDLGFVSEEEKHEAMAGALAFCHPSVNESLGIVLLESWLSGTPALVHARSAVLRDQCERSGGGLWFRNYAEFEEELALLADHEDLRARMAEAGRRYVVSEYAPEAVQGRLLAALRS